MNEFNCSTVSWAVSGCKNYNNTFGVASDSWNARNVSVVSGIIPSCDTDYMLMVLKQITEDSLWTRNKALDV